MDLLFCNFIRCAISFTINLKNLIQLLEAVNKLPYGNKMFLSPEEEELMKNGSHELKYMSYPQVF